MRKVCATLAAAIVALAGGACAQFEQTLSTLSPSGSTSVQSLLGGWTSSSSVASGINSCTNFQWQVKSQSGNSITADVTAVCAGGTTVTGTLSGQLTGNTVPYQITGTANVPGTPSCPFTIGGTARLENDTIHVPYSGSTCLGSVSGEEILKRATTSTPAPSTPTPTPTPTPSTPDPTPATNPHHVAPGPLSGMRAEQVVNATADEFPQLIAPFPSDAQSLAAAGELLRRMIWHLQLAGFQAGRQKNPSGALSSDKLTIFIDGTWHAFDCFRAVGTANVPTEVIFLEVFPASYVADSGIPD